ncbi:Hypp5893 [Branchiostoma lanceolatum]|uniref:Hypp5893 protein n=1 Tax=Branchiostoma lanceolatum TaxID=7740 RepID=A0A8J9VSC7_BRALA|nr:Hypp5893 [Branchiostoma lanceolatum]
MTQLLVVLEEWTQLLEKGEAIDAIYLDFRKAFDAVPHQRLLCKLGSYGVKGDLYNWVKDFLASRKQRVVLNGTSSSWTPVRSGIPQGSVLGPVLFVVYINDLPEAVSSTVRIFADDSKLYQGVKDNEGRVNLQKDLEALRDWSASWQLPFNVGKCKVLHMGNNNNRQIYTLGDQVLEETTAEKDLGVTVDNHLKFHTHTAQAKNKGNQMLGLIKKSFANLDEQTLPILFKTMTCKRGGGIMAHEQTPTESETAEQFALRLTTTVSSGFVTLAVAMGMRTGLFAQLSRLDGPRTSVQIAQAANMKERYVREWLAILVTARIVKYDRQQRTYLLPPHRRAVLQPGGKSVAKVPEFMRLLAGVVGDVADCFRQDGPEGVPYSAYSEFPDWQADLRKGEHETNLVANFLPTIPGLEERLETGIRMHDAACGRGIPTLLLAQHFPNSTFVGTDIDRDSVQWAAAESDRRGLANATFQVQDLAKLPADWSDSFDYVLVWAAVHDQADPERALLEIFGRTVKPGGLFSMVDVRGHTELADNMDNPAAPMMYGASLLHCVPVSLYFGGRGLGCMWGQELAVSMLKEAGFANIRVLDVPKIHGKLHFLCNKP